MKKKSASEESKSIKTFLLYTALVFSVILISFIIKAFFILQQSTFDGESQYTLAITKNDQVEEIISFNPTNDTIHILRIKDTQIPAASMGKFVAIIPEAQVAVQDDFEITTDVSKIMSDIGFSYNFVKSEATIVDIVRLALFSKNVPLGNRTIEEESFSKKEIAQEKDVDKLMSGLFIDNQLSAENVSIQIVNASGVSGMGSRLERVLVNLGANVVSVSTSRREESVSTIQYFGPESYTLSKVEKLLHLPVSQLTKEAVAKIVITIGTDTASTTKF